MQYNFITIEGCIGAGKTSLSTMISEDMNAKLILEEFDDNPFLPKFYKKPDKYAFQLELSFLAERYQQLKKELHHQDLFRSFTISDYFISKSLIFARKNLNKDEFILYNKLYNIVDASIPKPDLLVYLYLDVEKLQSNIIRRGRNYEKNIKKEYLNKIQDSYFEYITQIQKAPVLVIDTNNIDFVNNSEHYQQIKDVIFKEYPLGMHRIEI